jgi:hypothetical protein
MAARLMVPALAVLALPACTPKSPPHRPPPALLHATGDECLASQLDSFLDQLWTEDLMARIRGVVGQRPLRTIRPGDAVTMDFVPGRLNIELDDDGRIKRCRCG